MRLPESAAETGPTDPQELPGIGERYIVNPYPGAELLTRAEALNAINVLSGMLLIDGNTRRREQSPQEDR